MDKYEIKKVYTLTPEYIQEQHDGRKYIIFKETINGRPLRVKAFDFLSQPDSDLPLSIDVVVENIEPMFGMPLLRINRDWLITTLYGDEKLPKKFSFNIVGKINKEEYKSLLLKDSYGISHYFPIVGSDTLDNYSEGERITLLVDSINKNNKGCLYISLSRPSSENFISQYFRVFTTKEPTIVKEDEKPFCQITNYGEESETSEFKQSLVFHPKSSEVDVDSQVFNIMRSIAGFMNHIGGTLYIGVRNDGSAKGIENDYPELNKGINDAYGNYSADWDGWNRKLIDSVRKYLGSFAATLVNVEKEECSNVVVAKIMIEKSAKPIYVNNKILFRRQCNTTAMLTGDELTWFIIERLRGDSLGQFIEQKFGYETEMDENEGKENATSPSIDSITAGAIQDERNHNKWLYLRLFENGQYTIIRGNGRVPKSTQSAMICDYQLKQYHKNENQVLLLMYNRAGKVNKIDFDKGKNDWYYNDRNDIIQARNANAPWVSDSNVVIKCVDRNDMLVAFYKDGDKNYCYVRDVQDINPSHANRNQALFTGGHALLTRGAELCGDIMHIPGTYRNWIAPIVNKHVELSDPSKSGTIRRLIDVLKDIYPNNAIG